MRLINIISLVRDGNYSASFSDVGCRCSHMCTLHRSNDHQHAVTWGVPAPSLGKLTTTKGLQRAHRKLTWGVTAQGLGKLTTKRGLRGPIIGSPMGLQRAHHKAQEVQFEARGKLLRHTFSPERNYSATCSHSVQALFSHNP